MIGAYDLFVRSAKRYPRKKALVVDDVSYTYRDLAVAVNEAARVLSSQGIKEGGKVGILFKNGSAFVILVYALWKLGVCVSLLNYRMNARELAYCLEASECETVIFADEFIDTVRCVAQDEKNDTCFRFISETIQEDFCSSRYAGINDTKNKGTPEEDANASFVSDAAILNIYTGGTTGRPKAAVHTQQGLLLQIFDILVSPDLCKKTDVLLNYAPLFHIGGFSLLLSMFSAGATVVLSTNFNPDYLMHLVAQEQITQLFLIPPTIIERFDEQSVSKQEKPLPKVRLIHLAGGSSGPDVVERVFDLFPEALIANGYGMSERAVSLTNTFGRQDFLNMPDLAKSVGRPTFLSEAKLVDEDGREVSPGEIGELYGKSPCMMVGYKGIPSPFDTEGWFATGDLLKKDEQGNYYFMSRKKDMIKSGGENVYALEVEEALLLHPSVKEVAVVGLPDEFYGETVAAAIVLKKNGETVSADDLIERCLVSIASYKKPRRIHFMESLPKSSIGKIKKDQVREELIRVCKPGMPSYGGAPKTLFL